MDIEQELNEVLRELVKITAKDKHFEWGNYLLSAIQRFADDATKAKMVDDIKDYINLRKTKPHMFT
jgi:hypothetical protein